MIQSDIADCELFFLHANCNFDKANELMTAYWKDVRKDCDNHILKAQIKCGLNIILSVWLAMIGTFITLSNCDLIGILCFIVSFRLIYKFIIDNVVNPKVYQRISVGEWLEKNKI
jgi:hypothetical protein